MPIAKSSLIPNATEASTLEVGHDLKMEYRKHTHNNGVYIPFENMVPRTQMSKRKPFKELEAELTAKLVKPGGMLQPDLFFPNLPDSDDEILEKYTSLKTFLRSRFISFLHVLEDSTAFVKQLVFIELRKPLVDSEDRDPRLDAEQSSKLCLLPPPCGAHLAHTVANCLRSWETYLSATHLSVKEILFEYSEGQKFYPDAVRGKFEAHETQWKHAKEEERKAHEALVSWEEAREQREDKDLALCKEKSKAELFNYKKKARAVLDLYRVREARKLEDRAAKAGEEVKAHCLENNNAEAAELAEAVGRDILAEARKSDRGSARVKLVSIRHPDLEPSDFDMPTSEGGGDTEIDAGSLGLDLTCPQQQSMWEYIVNCIQIKKTVGEILTLMNDHNLLGVDLIPSVCSQIHNFCARTRRLFSVRDDVFGNASEKALLYRDQEISLEYCDTIRYAAACAYAKYQRSLTHHCAGPLPIAPSSSRCSSGRQVKTKKK